MTTNKTITSPQYILLYITEPLEALGQKHWMYKGIYDSEEQAIAALLSMPDHEYEHARIVCAPLPTVTLPDDFETIIGEPTRA